MESISEARLALERRRVRILWLFVLHIAIYAAAIALIFFVQPLGMTAGIANILYYIFLLRRQMKDYENAMARACVLYGLCRPWQKAAYRGDSCLTAEQLQDLKILPLHQAKNALLSRHGFSASASHIPLEGCELTLHYPAQVGGRQSFKFLSGTLLTAQLPSGCGDWLLLADGLLEPQAQEDFLSRHGFLRLKSGIAGYSLFSLTPDAEMPAALRKRLEKLLSRCPITGAVRFCPESTTIFFKGRFYTGRYRPNIAPDEAFLRQNGLPERDEAVAFFQSLQSLPSNP